MFFFKKNQKFRAERPVGTSAFTLVETLIAIGVLLLAIAGPMTLARQTLKGGPVSKNHITAYFLAQDAVEFVKNVRDTNTASGESWLTGLTPCLSGCIVDTSLSTVSVAEAIKTDDGTCSPLRLDPVTNRYGCDPSWDPSPYTRTTTLTVTVPDQEAVLTTTVSWTIDGRPYSFSATQSLFNIGAAIAEGISNLEPPELSGGGPSGTLTAGTVQVMATVLTNKASTCKWDFSSVDYDLMQNFFDTTGGTDHSAVIPGLQDGKSYVVYVRCRDQLGNENLASYPISFSVATPTGGGLVGYWPFDSNANDISGNNRNGTLTNGAVVTTASKIGTGALILDGVDDYVSIPSHTSLQGNQNLTLAFWVKKETATDQRLLGKSPSSTNKDYEIAVLANGTLRWESEVSSSGYSLNSAAGVIALNTWYHVVAVIDKTNDRLTLYVDGAQVAQDTTFGNNSAGTTAAIHVGRRVHGTSNFYTDGSIDDFRIYNFAMTGVQVASLYNAGLNSGATNITFDASGSATCNNTATCTITGFDLGNGSGNNRLVVVNVVTENSSNTNNVTFNGVSGTKVTEYDHTNSNLTGSLWYWLDSQLPSAAGSYNIVATANGSVIGNLVTVSSYKNVNQAAPTAFASSECTACSVAETSVNVATVNSLVVAATGHAGNQNYTGNNGVTKRVEVDNATSDSTNALGDKIYASTGSTLAGHTSGGTARQVNIVAVWAPLAGGSGDTTPPATISSLAVSNPTSNSVTLSWTAPGDDASAGTATSYDIRRASAPIVTGTDWSNAAVVSGEPAPSAAGTPESMIVSGLSPGTTYYFAIRTSDEVPNTSATSNSPSGTTLAGTGSLLARWTFDADGEDVTGNGHDATLSNGALVSAVSPKVGGGSLQLDGTNDYANTIDVDEINGANKATLAFWFKYGTAPGTSYKYLISKYVSGSVDFLVAFNNTNFNIDLGNGSGDSYGQWVYGSNLSTNTWHHAAVVFDGTQTGDANRLKLYINNVQRTLSFPSSPGQPIPAVIQGGLSAVPFRIGSREGTSGFSSGNMDDVRVYNYALSASEVTALFDLGGGSVPTAGLVAYYPFDSNANDASGNGNNGAFSNGAAITTSQKQVGAGAANFDGVDDFMSIPHSSSLNLGTGDWSIAFWQRTPVAAEQRITGKQSGGANKDFEIAHLANRQVYLESKSTASAEFAYTTSNAFLLNDWEHVVVTQDAPGMTPKMYVNGVEKTLSTEGITTVPPGNTSAVYVGARSGTSFFYTGQLDELRYYNRTLSLSEIQDLYAYTGGSSDTSAPSAIAGATVSNPTTNSLRLNWTAPGDDGSTGTATAYDIRRSTSPITEGNWASATQVSGEPVPAVAGTAQNMTVSGLNSNTTYYFAIKTSDEVPNTSAISNSPSGITSTSGGGTAVLVGHWPFDTNATDSSGNGLNGSFVQQAAVTATSPIVGAGSLVLDGTADEVLVGVQPSLNITAAMSVAGWVKVTNTSVNRSVLSRNAGGGSRGYSLRLNTGNGAEFHVSTDCTTEDSVLLSGTLSPGTWVHLAGTYEPGVALRIYLNGVLNNSVTTGVPASHCSNGADLAIGGRPNSTAEPMLGNLDDVRIYTGVLSGPEVAALYAMGGGGGGGSSLIAHIPFDSNVNASVGGFTGTAAGNAAVTTAQKIVGAGSLGLDGTGDYVSYGDVLDVGSGDHFSVSLWVRRATDTTTDALFAKRVDFGDANPGYIADFSASNDQLHFKVGDGTDNCQISSNTVFRNTNWHHVVVTWDGTDAGNEIYVDGVADSTGECATGAALVGSMANAEIFRVGAYSNATQPIDGNIDDVRMYDYKLTPSEVATLYAMGDSTAAVISNGSPTGTLPAGTTSIAGSVTTNENATCKWHTSDVAYASMANTFTGGGSTSHTTTFSGLSNGQNYTRYVRCQDMSGNTNSSSYTITFSVAAASSLVSHWPFNSATGSDNDDIIGTNEGTFTNGAAITTSQKQVGTGAVNLDGVNDYVALADSASLDITTATGITITAWIRPLTISGRHPILTKKCYATASGYEFAQTNGRLQFGWGDQNNAANEANSNNNVLTANTWKHVAVTYDGSTVRFYVDGAAAGAPAEAGSITANTLAAGIGASPPTCGTVVYFGGQIDNVKLHNSVLTPAQITAIYQETTP